MSTSLSESLIGSIVFFAALILSAAGIALFRRLSIKKNWLDRPNRRSSHTEPTPRGAGLIIVIVSLIAYVVSVAISKGQLSWGYIAGACLVALISWLDDLYSLAYLTRLGTHCLAAILLVWDTGYLQVFGVSEKYSVDLGLAGALMTIVWIVWSINAYNFMDGIDGLAGVQGVIAASVWAWISLAVPTLFAFNIAIVGACFGFLVHNWPPAKIFMGDVGSAFLGFTFGSMAVLFVKENPTNLAALPIVAVLVLWPFNLDAGLTRLRKALRFERFWEPHREHLYQKLDGARVAPAYICTIYGLLALTAGVSATVFLRTNGWTAALPIVLIIVMSFALIVIVKRLNDRSDLLINGR
jgi:UDP-N-acetylmuramyl pentapeptide phosphotransferase/UDP-N-acetylglucosamine-1-phosphate transferase